MKKLFHVLALMCLATFNAHAESSHVIRAAGAMSETFALYFEATYQAKIGENRLQVEHAKVIVVSREDENPSTQLFLCKDGQSISTEDTKSKPSRGNAARLIVLSCTPQAFFIFGLVDAPVEKRGHFSHRSIDWGKTCGRHSLLYTSAVAVAASFGHQSFCLEDWSSVKNPQERLNRELDNVAHHSPDRQRNEALRLQYEKEQEGERERASAEAWQQQLATYAQTLQSDIFNGYAESFEKHLNAGADINAPIAAPGSTDRRAPLLVALDKPESASFALALIKRGANLNPEGIYKGVNVLMLASGNSTPEVIKALLVRQKFEINQPNPNGATALSYAVVAGQTENVRLLLSLGADAQVKTREGSLTEIAALQGYAEIVTLLKQYQR